MLTKESSRGFCPAYCGYPTYEYVSKSGRCHKANCGGGRILPKPKGYSEVIRYHDEDEHFASYLRWVEDEYKSTPDNRFIESPYGIFIGRWRNARWGDEAQRRNLV